MIAVIDKELTARRAGITLTPTERLEVFGGDRLVETADVAEGLWGDTPHFMQRRHRRRLGRNYDDMAAGLSQYVHDAILANCHRHLAGNETRAWG